MDRKPTFIALLLGASLVLPACSITVNKSTSSSTSKTPHSHTKKPNSGSSNKPKPNSGASKSASNTKPNSSSKSNSQPTDTSDEQTEVADTDPSPKPSTEKPERSKTPPARATPKPERAKGDPATPANETMSPAYMSGPN